MKCLENNNFHIPFNVYFKDPKNSLSKIQFHGSLITADKYVKWMHIDK